ncbi:MAG: Lrp/AsnC family transcriptional regulator [Candidatus Ranarchaeia archaeon]
MLDPTDSKIIDLLQNDARLSYTDLARKLDMNEATVRHRVNKLEETGIIRNYTVVLDHSKMGLNSRAMVGVNVEPDSFLSVAKTLTNLKDVRSVYTCTGDHMVLFDVWFSDHAKLTSYIEKNIANLTGVTKVCPSLILSQLK